MNVDPVVFQFNAPAQKPSWRDKLPKLGPKRTKLLLALAALVIIFSTLSFGLYTYFATNKDFAKQHGLDVNDVQAQDESIKSQEALPGGNVAIGSGGTTGTDAPVVKLTATPASVAKGKTSHLEWSATNNPTSCEASDDWSGSRDPSGEADTPVLDKVQTYLFTITCKTATGTGFATVSVGAIEQGGTGNEATRPSVVIAANPSSIYVGDSTTLNWNATNSPSSCTASGDWSGVKSSTGSESTGVLSAAKQYAYTITCTNAAGSGFATATVAVGNVPADMPIVTISSDPAGPVTPGSSIRLSWNAANNPTSCTASGDWNGGKAGIGSETIANMSSIKTYSFTITCSNSAGSTFDTAAVQVIPTAPTVSITASPSSMYVNATSTITWSATNNPTSCTASGDWSGGKSASGTMSTGALGSVRTYSYSIQCKNAGGTSATKTATVVVTLPPVPVVTISANPISTSVGGNSNLTWSATNNPTSCTASGDWSGGKNASGTASTGTLSTARTYSYTLTCQNAGGSGSATTSVAASAAVVVQPPVVSISASPATIGTGGSSTLSWSATNNPTSCTASNAWSGGKSATGSQSTGAITTAGARTYTLSCSNSAGTGSASATVSVIATPQISISVSPASITTGSAATISWSVANSPASCTAGGGWSGSKAASGSQSTGTVSTAGSYLYSLSCTNAGGTTSASATLTATNPAPVYCGGKTPCYGVSDLAAHASVGNCWGWNYDWVINITTYRPSHKGGIAAGSTSTIENASVVCNHDLHGLLDGTKSIPGYKDKRLNATHPHKADTTGNTSLSQLIAFRVGYYDPSKP